MKLNYFKLLVVGSSLFVASTFAKAAPTFNAGMEFRTDLVQETTDEEAKKDVDQDSSLRFKVASAKLNFKGMINEKTSYGVKLSLNNALDSNWDGSSEALEEWHLDRTLCESLKLKVGKFKLNAGGIESKLYEPMDLYHTSNTYDYLSMYGTGVNLSYTVAKQRFEVELVNSPMEQDNQQTPAVDLAYFGDFADGMIQPVVMYGMLPSAEETVDASASAGASVDSSGSTSTSASTTTAASVTDEYQASHFSVGSRFNFKMGQTNKLQLELELNNVTIPEYDMVSGTTTTPELEKVMQATIVGARFDMQNLDVLVRYSMDKNTVDGEDLTSYNRYSLGVEYTPESELNYRLHAILASSTMIDEVNTKADDIAVTQINIGAAARF